MLQKCGNHWCRIGTTQVVNSNLANGTSSNVVSLIETYKYNNCSSWITQQKGLTKLSNSCAVAGNGLMYDGCQSGKTNWNSASNYCSSKGMRLPTLNETKLANVNGVPSCSSHTWTSSVNKFEGDNYYGAWDSVSSYYNGRLVQNYVRCVR